MSKPNRTPLKALLAELAESLQVLEKESLFRKLTFLEAVKGSCVRIAGGELVCWCSNDYLGLSTHPALAQAAAEACSSWGVGCRASRLLAGSTAIHQKLEEQLAAFFHAEAALVYPSGYLANLGTLGCLLTAADAVIVDRLAHASLLDAARATAATFRVFHHNDVEHLQSVLGRLSKAKRRFVVTEGVFSMDGDSAPLAELIGLCDRFGAILYVDDAHGAFVCGKTGRGSLEAAGMSLDRFLYMGTLGKALGTQGGFVAGPKTFIRYLQNKARTFIYSTGLAVPSAAAALEALKLLEQDASFRFALDERVKQLQEGLKAFGGIAPARPSHIVPVILGKANRAIAVSEQLLKYGHWAPAIRPPTVPENTARLRLSLTALHTPKQVDHLVGTLQAVLSA